MSRTGYYVAQFVESFPTPLEKGVLYISVTYSTAGHVCPCGCKGEVVIKLSPARWQLIFDGEVSLKPSVAAVGLACKSHYFITRGQVDWHRKLDPVQTEKAQAADRRAVEDHRVRVSERTIGWCARLPYRKGKNR